MNLGPIEFLFLLFAIIGVGVCIWAIVDALGASEAQWAAVGQSKIMWVALVAGGMLFAGPVGWILAVVYLVTVRPKLRAVRGTAPPTASY